MVPDHPCTREYGHVHEYDSEPLHNKKKKLINVDHCLTCWLPPQVKTGIFTGHRKSNVSVLCGLKNMYMLLIMN